MSDEITTLLKSYHNSTLQRIAKAAGLEIAPGGNKLHKAQLIRLLQRELFTEARVQQAYGRLNKKEKIILNWLLRRGGHVATASFRRRVIRAGLAKESEKPVNDQYYRYSRSKGYEGAPARRRSGVFEDVIAYLTLQGLVFSTNPVPAIGGTPYKLQFHPAREIFVPEAIRPYLPEPTPAPVGVTDWHPSHTESGTPGLFLRELYLYWDYVRHNQVSLIQAGYVSKRHLRALNKALLVPDPNIEEMRREYESYRLFLLRLLLQELKLVQAAGSELQATGQDTGIPAFWQQSPAEQTRACLRRWTHLSSLKELDDDANALSPRFLQARQKLLDVLRELPAGTWIERDVLLDLLREKDVDFLFAAHSKTERVIGRGYWYQYVGNRYYSNPEKLLADMEEWEEQFVARCISGLLLPLGLVTLGYDEKVKKWHALRRTPWADAVLGEAPVAPSEGGKVIVQPNFQLLAMGPVGLEMLARLDLFAERRRADARAFEYHLSRESVYAAQQKGMPVAEIRQFLTEASETALPQNVRRSLEEWEAHHERIVFRTGVALLQTAAAATLDDLLADEATGKHIGRTITPLVALVDKREQTALVKALLGRELLPVVAGTAPETADNSVTILADGRITPIHAVPSLILRGRLERVAQKTEDEQWQITPESARRAGGSRAQVRALLAELGKLHRGKVPPSLVEQIKAWGGYYGEVAVETVTLLAFQSQEILEELRDHPRLKKYLTPFSAGERALATVPASALAQVKEVLAQLGVNVREGLDS